MPLERRVPASEEFANCGPKLALASIFVIHTWHMCALIDPHLAHVCTDCNFPSGSKTALWRGGTGDLTYRVGRMTTASIGRRGGGHALPVNGIVFAINNATDRVAGLSKVGFWELGGHSLPLIASKLLARAESTDSDLITRWPRKAGASPQQTGWNAGYARCQTESNA